MSILTLNDGTTINVLETSNTSQINVSGNLEEVSMAMSEITTDSLKNADLAGTTLVNKVYTGFSGTKEGDVSRYDRRLNMGYIYARRIKAGKMTLDEVRVIDDYKWRQATIDAYYDLYGIHLEG